MPKKRISRNHCNKCKYNSNDGESCLCRIPAYYDDSYEAGCNYKASELRDLYRYTQLELSEDRPYGDNGLSDSWEQAKKNIEEKIEKGEEISAQESERFKSLYEEIRFARKHLDFDQMRCTYVLLINEFDKKGKFKRLLKKMGRYPKFVDDFTIGSNYEEEM